MKRIITPVMAVLLFFSCTAPFDINTHDSEPVVVIYGCLTNENKNHVIRVTRSSPYFQEADNEAINNAKVWVTSSSGVEYSFKIDSNGYYVSQKKFSALRDVTYRLFVEIESNNGGEKALYEAETTTPPIVSADSIEANKMSIMGYGHYMLNLYIQEPIEAENYYLFRFFINDTVSNHKIGDYIISNDQFFNGEYLNGVNITIFEDATDPEVVAMFEDNENIYMVQPGDRIRLQILNIEKGYYYFIRDCITEKYGENPFFGGPPSNIYTNLSNGAVGYFTSFCIHEKGTVVP